MHGRRTSAAGRIARWALLSCTLFGLAVMHTLGHAGPQAATHHQVGAAVTIAASGIHEATAMSALVPGECSGDHCDDHGSGAMSGWSVCLAVLGGLIAVVLLALLSWMLSGRRRTREKHARRPPIPRGPPRPSAGLTLVSVAVLRI